MALPKLNDVPKYELVIPSTGKTVSFRPFLVKEQKVLLMALESQDDKQVLNAIVNTITACLYDNVKFDSLTTFDIEYLFTQIRAKSVGENSTVNLKCMECEELNEVVVPLDDIKVNITNTDKIVKINDQFSVEMKYPKYSAILLNTDNKESESFTESLYEMAIMCLGYLITEDERVNFDDEPRESIEGFLENLTASQFENIITFINNIPKLTHDIEYECSSCNHNNVITLQGIQDFF